LILPLLGTGLVGGACSSSSDDRGLASNGGSSARGGSGASGGVTGGGAKGGSSTGGSSTGGSSTGGSSTGGSSTGGRGGSGNATSTGGSSNATGKGGSGATSADACPGVLVDAAGQGGNGAEACAGVSTEAEPVAVDLFIMMDRSVSMANFVPNTTTTRWEALQQAMQEFVQSASGDDLRAGIGFFGVTSNGDDSIDCDSTRYAKAAVDIGDLSATGPDLVAAMADMLPGGLTPAGPALSGALDYASVWAEAHVGRATAVVFVSDGYPTQCEPLSITDVATIARNAHLNAPYVRTYAIGVGADVNLDAVALAGGTHKAFTVSDGDIGTSFANALRNVSNSKLACQYALPAPSGGGQTLDLEEVSVTYTTAGDATTEEIPSLAGSSSCANSPNGGWYYDDPVNPSSIEVCPCTCARFDAGRVDVRVGCRPILGPR
jgi:hypothetical protein